MKFLVWFLPFQLGNAITLPLFVPTIIVKSQKLWENKRLQTHELVHVNQIYRLGRIRYILIHIWARIKTRNIWGIGHWIEDEAYGAENK